MLRGAITAVTFVTRVLTGAIIANPIVALIAAIAFGAVLIISNWSSVKKWFISFFNWFKSTPIFSMIEKGIGLVKGLFGDSKINVNDASINKVKDATNINSTNTKDNKQVHNNQSYNINITGGGNVQDTAKEVTKHIENLHKTSLAGA